MKSRQRTAYLPDIWVMIAPFGIVSACVFNLLPIKIEAIKRSGSALAHYSYYLGTAELALYAFSVLFASAALRMLGPRRILAGAAISGCAANLIAATQIPALLLMGLLINACCMGLVSSALTVVIAARRDAVRGFAFSNGSTLIFLCLMNSFMGYFITPTGFTVCFLIVAALCVVGLLSLKVCDVSPPLESTEPVGQSSWVGWLPMITLMCEALMISMATSNTVQIGSLLGLSVEKSGAALAIASFVAIGGPIVAHFIDVRFGLIRPLIAGLSVMLLARAGQFVSPNFIVMGLLMGVATAGTTLATPCAIRMIAIADRSGRLSGMVPAFVLFGATLGPLCGERLLSISLPALLLASAMVLLCGACTATTANFLLFRRSQVAA